MQTIILPLPATKTCETYAEREKRHFMALAEAAKREGRRAKMRRIAGWLIP